MKKQLFITICLALVAIAANAQTITDELRRNQQGQGKVVINQSQEIEDLVNNTQARKQQQLQQQQAQQQAQQQRQQQQVTPVTKPEQKQATTTAHPDQKTETPTAKQTNEHPTQPSTTTTQTHRQQTSAERDENPEEERAVDTNKKIMRHSYKTTGYRIQVYAGGNKRTDRAKCEQIAQRIKSSFPDLPIYVHFYSPSWKCRVGNFTSTYEAKSVLQQIKRMGYDQACIVKGTISIQY